MKNHYARAFNHLVSVMQNPGLSKVKQDEYNKERFTEFEDAMRVRPVFLPVSVTLPADAQSLPIKGETVENNDYDIIITGAITDGENKRINFYREIDNRRPLVKVGSEANAAKISLDAIAGKSKEAAGITGVQPFTPFVLRTGDALALEIFKDEDTADDEIVNVVFNGYRVYDLKFSEAQMSEKLKQAVLKSIGETFTPEDRWSAVPVKFADGAVIVETPKSEEPLLILGFRTTISNAMVNLGFSSDTKFSRDFFPIWALAAEAGNDTDNYNRLLSPIPVPPLDVVYLSFKDTINGVSFADDGQIELLLRKP